MANLQQTGGGGGGTTLTGTGIARNTGACTELSGDVTTSGSNAATVVQVNGAAVPINAGMLAANSTGQLIDVFSGGVVQYIEDFINTNVSVTVSSLTGARWDNGLAYGPITGGTTGTIVSNVTSFINPGEIVITTPATSGNGVMILGLQNAANGNSPFTTLSSNVPWQADFWVKLPATITNYCVRVGLLSGGSPTADPNTNGMWVEYDTANVNSNSKFTLRTVNSSASTYVVSAVTPGASTWYHIRVSSTVAGTYSAQIGSANGALGSAITTASNVTAIAVAPGIQVIPRTTAAAVLTVDRMSFVAMTGRV